MASSVVSAVIDLYNSISATAFGGTTRPPIRLGPMPQTTSTGTPQRPPYVVLFDDSQIPEFNSSFGGTEGGTIRLELYALKLDAHGEITVDSMARGAKYANAAPSAKAGLDWGTLVLTGCLYPISLHRIKEQRSYAGFDYQDNAVHKCVLTYRVVVGLNASQAPTAP